MSKLNIESTSEGSIAKFNGGQTIINEKENRCVIPPEASKEARASLEAEGYITIVLIPNIEPNIEPNKEQNKKQDNVR